MGSTNAVSVHLRNFELADLAFFFEQQLDPEANFMAAFTSKNPYDREAFDSHWQKILADPSIFIQTIIAGKEVAGYILHHPWFGDPEITYWIGREHWGKGIATAALVDFLQKSTLRPLFGRVAADNIASRRVLEKCGFTVIGQEKGFSNARGEEVEELILVIREDVDQ